jgi:biopolymer transport protein ExbD
VALIDVVLFLLMYFMLATDLNGEEKRLGASLQTESGEKSGSRGGSSLRPQIVSVEPAGGGWIFRIGERTARDRESLTQILAQLPTDNGVIVRAAPVCPVAGVAAALQACSDAGFTKVSYVASGE